MVRREAVGWVEAVKWLQAVGRLEAVRWLKKAVGAPTLLVERFFHKDMYPRRETIFTMLLVHIIIAHRVPKF